MGLKFKEDGTTIWRSEGSNIRDTGGLDVSVAWVEVQSNKPMSKEALTRLVKESEERAASYKKGQEEFDQRMKAYTDRLRIDNTMKGKEDKNENGGKAVSSMAV
jgi:hypothetical protein